MNKETVNQILCEELENLAPEIDISHIDKSEDLREELDIDSMDFLRLTIALGKRLDIVIPDAEHARLVTFDTLFYYLVHHCCRAAS
ncbi:MAG: acyl carrier protein [Pontibacterium sp.]